MKLKTTLLILFWPILLQCNSFGQLAISGLTALGAAPDSGDLIPIVDISDLTQSANGSTKKVTFSYLLGIGSLTQAYDADLTTYAGITPSANIQSLLGSADYSAARTNLGLAIGTNVQAYDADLTTYAGITPSANIQSLLGSADYATARTNLGLVIGTNVQAYDADLTTYAGITPSADMQSFLAAANDAAALTALGATGIATPTDLGAGTALTVGNAYYNTAMTTRTLTITGTLVEGSEISLEFICAAEVTLTWPANIYRAGQSGTVTTTVHPIGNHQLKLYYSNALWKLVDTGVDNETANYILKAPDAGGTPAYAALDATDIPNDLLDSQHYAAGSIDNEHLAIDIITADEMANADHGDVSWTSGVATVDNVSATAIKPIYTEVHGVGTTIAANECYGGVHYIQGAYTIVLPAVAAGMSVTFIMDAASVGVIDPSASEVIRLEGAPLTGGFAVKSAGAIGEIAVLTYHASGVWYCASATFITNGS